MLQAHSAQSMYALTSPFAGLSREDVCMCGSLVYTFSFCSLLFGNVLNPTPPLCSVLAPQMFRRTSHSSMDSCLDLNIGPSLVPYEPCASSPCQSYISVIIIGDAATNGLPAEKQQWLGVLLLLSAFSNG